MTIIIHRGANQIGGCITEISTDCCKVLIDLGSNLDGATTQEFSQEELDTITKGTDAIFFTHYHGDHVGLHGNANKDIPGNCNVLHADFHVSAYKRDQLWGKSNLVTPVQALW